MSHQDRHSAISPMDFEYTQAPKSFLDKPATSAAKKRQLEDGASAPLSHPSRQTPPVFGQPSGGPFLFTPPPTSMPSSGPPGTHFHPPSTGSSFSLGTTSTSNTSPKIHSGAMKRIQKRRDASNPSSSSSSSSFLSNLTSKTKGLTVTAYDSDDDSPHHPPSSSPASLGIDGSERDDEGEGGNRGRSRNTSRMNGLRRGSRSRSRSRHRSPSSSPVQKRPWTPEDISGYLQVATNFIVVFIILYFALGLILTIQQDVQRKVNNYTHDLSQEIEGCRKKYIENNCYPDVRVPISEEHCAEWERCMSRDPAEVSRARISAEILAEIVESFVKPISHKTMLYIALFGFGTLAISNIAFGLVRSRKRRHALSFPSTYITEDEFDEEMIPMEGLRRRAPPRSYSYRSKYDDDPLSPSSLALDGRRFRRRSTSRSRSQRLDWQ
ncbi:MAG: Di-sulfide bridge nucleocytoplasmic transport domain-containing protein [Piptocephalis tieghemiana]|nr:MAG: Di-sulfide bridge nucleocytoplasmic transport domain-containing protein [Piptocephalis tieghemiana]